MNDTASCRYPWLIERSELPTEITDGEQVMNTEVSSEITCCHIEKSEEAVSFSEVISPELYASPSLSNDDLKELESSLIDMERYVDELQFELLKFRQAEEAKNVSATQPPLPLQEFIKDLQSISDSLDAHKAEYTLVADVQAENVRLREEILKVNGENERLRNELETLKQIQKIEVQSLKAANDEKMAKLNKDYEERVEKQSKEFTELMAKERAEFATQRDAWNEEKATLLVEHAKELAAVMKTKEQQSAEEEETCFRSEILREVSEIQNQAREQVAQLQSKIERLLVNSVSSARLSAKTRLVCGSNDVGNRPLSSAQTFLRTPDQSTEIPPQNSWEAPTNSAVVQPQAQNVIIGAGQRKSHFSHLSDAEKAKRSRGKSLKVAAVPPVLVVSEEPHPLLEDSSIVSAGGKRNADCIELPSSKWRSYTDSLDSRQAQPSYFNVAPAGRSKLDVAPIDEWFDFSEDKSQIEEVERQNQRQVLGDSRTSLPLKTSVPPPQLQTLQPQQRAQLQAASLPKKRHLFTVHSEST